METAGTAALATQKRCGAIELASASPRKKTVVATTVSVERLALRDTFTENKMQWLERVTRDRGLLAQHKCTGYAIAIYLSRKEGCARPSIPRLAADLAVSENTVRSGIKALVATGLLAVTAGGGRKTANRYMLILSPPKSQDDGREPDTQKPLSPLQGKDDRKPLSGLQGNASDEGCSTLQGIPEKPFNPEAETLQSSEAKPFSRLNPNPLIEPIEEPSEESISPKPLSKTSFEEEFEGLWRQYPRRVAKGQALKAFRAARKKAELATIMAGVLRYAAERSGQDPKYTRHLATWLNAESWLDEAPSPFVTAHPRSPRLTTGKDRAREVLEHMLSIGEDEAHE